MADEEKAEKEKSSGGLLPVINLVLLVLVLAVGGFVAWKLISMEQAPAVDDKTQITQTEETTIPEAEDEQEGPPIMMDIDNMTVNLADTDQSRFLRAKIKLEVRSEEAKAKVSENIVQVNDLIITLLASKKFSEIRTPQGKYALKEDLVYRLNRVIGGNPIKKVFLGDFVVQ